ncbi:MAG TPA: DUF885 domain-containing protein [Candidatus Kapabacteria bacterium]|nr:DUF885 domain-containing protein [Candidatus Kapabacteria bacterium]
MTFRTKHFHSFNEFRDHVLDLYFSFHPTFASIIGLHQYDNFIEDYSAANRNRYVEDLTEARDILHKEFDRISMDPTSSFERSALSWKIDEELFRYNSLREFEWNPMFYNQQVSVNHLFERDYAPLDIRSRSALLRLRAIPRVLAVARQNLLNTVDKTIVETAIASFEGRISYLDELPLAHLNNVTNHGLREMLDEAVQDAKMAILSFIESMRNVLLPQASYDSFRLGAEKMTEYLARTELVTESIADLQERGQREMDRLWARMAELTREIDSAMSPEDVFRTYVESEHFSEKNLIPETESMLERIRKFLIAKNIITVPSEVRCKVAPTPAHMRWAFAAMNSPGAFEQTATEAYYYVTPPDPKLSPEKRKEYMQGYSRSVMELISIHEAYPGHYVHFLHLQKARTKVGKSFWSYSFLEGWAHYTEEMMIDAGYCSGDLRIEVACVQEALIRLCRYMSALGRHAGNMTIAESQRLFEDKALLRPIAAKKEAERSVFDPGYLFYTLGKFQIQELRKRVEQDRGFALQSFHDELLSYGTAPLPIVSELMLRANA